MDAERDRDIDKIDKKVKKKRKRKMRSCDFCKTSICGKIDCKTHAKQKHVCPKPDMDYRTCPFIGKS